MRGLRALRWLTLASWLLPAAALAGAVEVTLISDSSDTYLTDVVRLRPADGSTDATLTLPGARIPLAAGAYATSHGRRVSIVTPTPQETAVRLLDGDGRTIWHTSLAPGRKVLAFGLAVAAYEPSLHQPGIPYDFEIVSASGTTRLERSGRVIFDVTALEEYLVVSSSDAEGDEVETEVLDAGGRVPWRFGPSARSVPRVAVQGSRAAAIHPGRPESVLEVSNRADGRADRLPVPGAVLTNVAFLSDASAVLAWGGHTTALLDVDGRRVLWQTTLPASAKPYPIQLNAVTSIVAPIGGTVAMMAREKAPGGEWDVNLLLFDVRDGSIVETRTLHRDEEPPTHVKRFAEGEKEWIVLPHRIYALEPQP